MSGQNSSRDHAVQGMFDRIAGRYDLLNRVISLRLDTWWRKQAIATIVDRPEPLILDLGTGTGDLAFTAAKQTRGQAVVIGLDFSFNMLRLAQQKKLKTESQARIGFIQGSAMAAPFKSSVFDGAMTAFVLRNISDLSLFFAEAFRVLKPGAKLVSLDMFPPSKHWFASLYAIYFYRFMPCLGGVLAGDRSAYQYLADSVRQFHAPETVGDMIRGAGFGRVTVRKYLCGAVCMHVAEKN